MALSIIVSAVSPKHCFDGPHSPANSETVVDDPSVPARAEEDDAAPDERTERPRRLAKRTTQFSDCVYY